MPFQLTLHSLEQLQFLKQRLAQTRNIVLHVDCTAGILRRPAESEKNIFLCSLVITGRCGEHRFVSLSDVLLERTRSEDISEWLLRFMCAYVRICGDRMWNRQNIGPRVICSDWSLPIIHGVLNAIIQMSFPVYLQTQYERLTSTPVSSPSSPIIIICCAHLIARVSRTLKIKKPATRHRFLRCFALIQMAASLHEAKNIWKDIVTVFKGHEDRNVRFEALKRLQERTENFNDMKYESADAHDERSTTAAETVSDLQTLSHLSPFSAYFADDGIPQKEYDDLFYAPEAVSQVLRTWLPFFPLWAHCTLVGTDVRGRVSNSAVESYFKAVKIHHGVSSGGSRTRLQRFTLAQRRFVKQKLRSAHQQLRLKVLPPRYAGKRRGGIQRLFPSKSSQQAISDPIDHSSSNEVDLDGKKI